MVSSYSTIRNLKPLLYYTITTEKKWFQVTVLYVHGTWGKFSSVLYRKIIIYSYVTGPRNYCTVLYVYGEACRSNIKSLRLRKSLLKMLVASIVIRSKSAAPIATPILPEGDRRP